MRVLARLRAAEQGRAREGEPLLREALAIRLQALGQGHWQTAEAESALGACLSLLHRFEEAEQLLIRGYGALREERGGSDRHTEWALDALIEHYHRSEQPEKAGRIVLSIASPD